jgi:hypothetical protein
LREAVRSEEPKPTEMKSGLEEALLSSMPQDVTAEEIAAIKAAAAAFSAPGNESSFRQTRDHAEATSQQPVANAGERTSEFAGSENPSAVAQVEASAEKATAAVPVSEVDAPIAAPAAAIASESAANTVSADPGTDARKLGDDEVTAALASLSPANGYGDSAAIDQERNKWEASRDQVPVTMAVAGATQEFSGPRWIAESVALLDDEATLVLEQEMEKAYAAFAAADAARMSFASRADEVPSAVAETPATNSESVSYPGDSSSNSNGSEPTPPEPAMQVSAEESEAPAPAPRSETAAPSTVDAVSESTVSAVEENAAYAAAASASAGTTEVTISAEATTQSAPSAETSDNVSVASEPHEREGESELAAAWANWKQVRESVIGSQLSSQIAETVAEIKESNNEAQPEPQVDASSATEEETSDKLMAEIAKKMGKEKKK